MSIRVTVTLYRDVVVIGGGSAGTYTAVRLKDYKKTVAVVERNSRLGGHAETYIDPETGYAIDIGVVTFAHLKVVTDYFARFNVPLTAFPWFGQFEYVDFPTGRAVNYTPPSAEGVSTALSAYSTQLEKYPALQGSFSLTYPVEPDLLLSFGEFVAKYNLGDMVPQIFANCEGYAPLLNISMLYIFKYLSAGQISSFAQSFLTTAHHDTQEPYRQAMVFLGRDDVLLDSTVVSVNRSGTGPVRVFVQTPTGRRLINMGGFDLSDNEKALFSQFSANGYYAGILNDTGFDIVMKAVGTNEPYGIPQLPGPYFFGVNQGLTQVYYGSPKALPEDDVKADILAIVRRIQKARGIHASTTPRWLAFFSHSPFNLMVPNEAIRDGFYAKLFALQGRRHTFYNGAAWHTQDSSVLWQFTEDYILPILLASS
ncbi:FAD/NAD(P)-binding domain-containing protein [Hypoxylon sp. FL0543]|nr:FAD/NAD(P)-binding domain-containing protein [Hypoxylon sp. FL0543]